MPWSSKWSFALHTKLTSLRATCTAHLVILNFYRQNCIWCGIQTISKCVCSKVYLQKINVFVALKENIVFRVSLWRESTVRIKTGRWSIVSKRRILDRLGEVKSRLTVGRAGVGRCTIWW